MVNRLTNPRPQFSNSAGLPYSGGILRFYASGTSTPLSVYSNSDGVTGASTTITLNSAGRPSQDIFLSSSLYKMTLEDSLGNIIFTADPVFTSDYSTTAKVQGYSGNPNTHVAGTASAGAVPADMVWDRSNNALYICTTTGNAAAAVWTVANVTALKNWTTAGRNVSPTAGTDFGYNTSINALEFWNGTIWLLLGYPPGAQRLTSGTAATFTPSGGAVRWRVRMWGAGGGGGARTTNAGANGTASSFQVNSTGTAWTAALGAGGAIAGAGGAGGSGGTDGSTGTLIDRAAGADGGVSTMQTDATGDGQAVFTGGAGGSSSRGGAGMPAATTGGSAKTNSGSGGAGGNSSITTKGGGGGGAGEYVEFWVTGMTTATYTVGAKGTGGAAGGSAGGDGGAGLIIVEEYYN